MSHHLGRLREVRERALCDPAAVSDGTRVSARPQT